MERAKMLDTLAQHKTPFDVLVIGGGATGASVALDAAARGFSVVLLERFDFGKGTSSRSTKLVHGGVRYLAQGNLSLVRDALHERKLLREHAPHIVHELSFVLPCQNLLQQIWYSLGFRLYDFLAGRSTFHPSRWLSQKECLVRVPTLLASKARGGILYSDGQFDDCRLLISMLRTAVNKGAIVINYATVTELTHDEQGKVSGAMFSDNLSGDSSSVRARCVINATGPFCDAVRALDVPAPAHPLVAASQGVHIVLKREFFPSDTAMIVPRTSDGRVLFMIPWHGHVVVGTTDTPVPQPSLEPQAQDKEVQFLLHSASEYLVKAPSRGDILSVFTGIRPLVARRTGGRATSQLSRDHTIDVSPSGLMTITGGKWTTARKMGEDCIAQAIRLGRLPDSPCATRGLFLHGARNTTGDTNTSGDTAGASLYGTDCSKVDALTVDKPELAIPLVEGYPLRGADVIWFVRHEMAMTVEDVLARRSRLLFLNVNAAEQAAPRVAELMARELGQEPSWISSQLQDFSRTAAFFRC